MTKSKNYSIIMSLALINKKKIKNIRVSKYIRIILTNINKINQIKILSNFKSLN